MRSRAQAVLSIRRSFSGKLSRKPGSGNETSGWHGTMHRRLESFALEIENKVTPSGVGEPCALCGYLGFASQDIRQFTFLADGLRPTLANAAYSERQSRVAVTRKNSGQGIGDEQTTRKPSLT